MTAEYVQILHPDLILLDIKIIDSKKTGAEICYRGARTSGFINYILFAKYRSVEMASFQILEMAAVKINNKQIVQLLLENYNEAKADRILYLLISAKYITNK